MPLRWIEGQDELFARWCHNMAQSPEPSHQRVLQQMLDIHDELGEHPLAENAWAWYGWLGPFALTPGRFIDPSVSVRIDPEYGIRISYPLPPSQAPWPNALIVGHADLTEEAIPMIAEAFARLSATYDEFEPRGRPDQIA
ncbi:MAG TPA: hypothetical protein VGE07_18055 [Herpetosiphonaceae bacterium]